jgi:DNA-binding NtrC family response regulator
MAPTKILFISDHFQDYQYFIKRDDLLNLNIELMTHAEANRKHVFQYYFDLFLIDLREPWLAIPMWIREQAQQNYFFQIIFISDNPISDELAELLEFRIFKIISQEASFKYLTEVVHDASIYAEHHRFAHLKNTFTRSYSIKSLLGNHPDIKGANDFIEIVSKTPFTPCLIRGELGTGKELCAQLVHQANHSDMQTFNTINCENTTTNELMGDVFGVAGEVENYGLERTGMLQKCTEGTLVLDNIEQLPQDVQNKLLIYLETKTFKPLGSDQMIDTQTRLIGLTRHDLEWFVKHYNFNSELFYRLKAFEITLAPLREKVEDIELLSNYYLQYYNNQLGKGIKNISPSTVQILKGYRWPGNVKELKNIIERAAIICSGDQILPDDLPDNLKNDNGQQRNSDYLGNCTMKELERLHILHALMRTKGNKSRAAQILDISRTTLREKMRIYELH